MQVHLLK